MKVTLDSRIFPWCIPRSSYGCHKLCHVGETGNRKTRMSKLSMSNLLGLLWTVNKTVVLLVHVVN